MAMETIRARIDAYTKEKYGIDPEILPFSHEDYEIYRHTETGKWNWVSMVLDGSVSFENICRWLDESYLATQTKVGNQKTPLPKRESTK